MQLLRLWSVVSLAAGLVFAQINTSTLDGVVSDPQGALIPNAEVTVTNTLTGQMMKTITNDRGHWVVPSLSTATYSVAVTAAGFKKAEKRDVKLDAGIPATVNMTLEVGAVSETVEVTGGADVLQTSSATVSSDLTGRQVHDLPIPSRNATDLLVTMPGTQTPAGPRNTTFQGLPQATMNMTLDGVNIQDNLLKNGSGGAFYPVVYPRTDAVEEVSVTSAASGAESLGEGAVQIKFVTKSGTNQWHGGAFVQERNTFLNANTYFNNIDGLARDRILLHQVGAHIGGPIIKNRLFIFFNYEVFRFPQSWNAGSFQTGGFLTVLAPDARNGYFNYQDTTGKLQRVNLYSLAAASGFTSTPDPIIANTLSQIADATTKGSLFSRVGSNNDYNRQNFNFLTPGEHKIDFPQGKLDYIINAKHHFEATGGVNPYRLFPDGINGVIPIFPGSGTVLGSPANAGQREAFWTGSAAVRSAWSNHWTSEIRFGASAGNVLFFNDVTPNLFSPWRGYAPSFSYVTNPYTRSSFSRRNNPVKQLNGNASWIHSAHLLNFGGSFSQINEWVQSGGTQFIPGISFGVVSTDPIINAMFTAGANGNFPNASANDLANAESLYALLTGRVSSINRSVVIDEKTHTYGANGSVDRVRQREFGMYAQDSWKLNRRLTLNYGLRFENQYPFRSFSGTYTRPSYAGLYGISGVGNLFKPNTLSGTTPQLTLVNSPDVAGYSPTRFVSPTVGAAWVLPAMSGPLSWIFGKDGQSVLRGGFAVTSTREQLTITGVWGNNQGRTISTALDPTTNAPDVFGPAGSVLFRDPALPVRTVATTPTYPIAVLPGNSINDYDPNLKARYVESWNIGLQRSLSPNTVIEARYVGNRSARAWTALNLNETNIFESGFLDQFKIAQSNLAIARSVNSGSNDFTNRGLPGQKDIPMITTALGATPNSTQANQVAQGQAAALASSVAGNTAQMARLTAAGYAPNLFQVNPATGGSGANLTTNQGGSTYQSLQIELNRRMSNTGLLAGISYTWSHSLATGNVLTLRNLDGVTFPSAFDQRHAFKLNWIYELPFGPHKHFLSGVGNVVARKAIEGWQISSIARINSGIPSRLNSGRTTYNGTDGGVVLYNMTTSQLQDMMQIRKDGSGIVYYLPQSVIDNTLAAFQLNTKTLNPSAPYIGPASTPGQFGNQIFLYGPWFQKWDFSLVKKTRIGEKGKEIEFRANALNAFNMTNFFLVGSNAGNITVNTAFGQTRNAFTDINSTNDPGSRLIEFQLRFSF
jgi:hypothetical protein